MEFSKIDLNNWTRKESFEYFLKQASVHSATHEIRIEHVLNFVKSNHYKFYPLFIYSVLRVINSNYLYRLDFNDQGELGFYDSSVVAYSIFDNKRELFSYLETADTYTFAEFHRNYLDEVEKYRDTGKLFPMGALSKNVVNISMAPWASFNSYNVNNINNSRTLLPSVSASTFQKRSDGIKLPVTFQIHDAAGDSYQTAQFFNKLQEIFDEPEEL
ncbi:CatA-like O-acetyltransferase [Companilactobacillus sp. FL22-1]|uniref:CatA-like O-acetyltransferase n=1 Tax=Companilactobacillus sp. FL22-1 TaxID=3373892 RepID=UPI003753F508